MRHQRVRHRVDALRISLSHTHTHTRSLSNIHSLSHTHTLSLTHSLCVSLAHTLSLSDTQVLSPCDIKEQDVVSTVFRSTLEHPGYVIVIDHSREMVRSPPLHVIDFVSDTRSNVSHCQVYLTRYRVYLRHDKMFLTHDCVGSGGSPS